jgi:hypothetical protein
LADAKASDPFAHNNHLTRELVAEHAWRANGEVSLHDVDVGLAYASHGHPQQDFARARCGPGEIDRHQLAETLKADGAH